MKTKLFIFILFNLFLFSFTEAQQTKKYSIPTGQELYTTDVRNTDIKPYKKKYIERNNGQAIQLIEVGNYVIREMVDDSLQIDTTGFLITTYKINGQDTIIDSKLLEIKKTVKFDTPTDLEFSGDTITLKNYTLKGSYQKIVRSQKGAVSLEENNLYYVLNDDNYFSYQYREGRFDVGIHSIPIIQRLGAENPEKENTLNTGFQNLNFYVGIRANWFRQKRNKLKAFSLAIGPYIGLTAIDLEDEKKLGTTGGITLLFFTDRLGYGISMGAESLLGSRSEEWTHHNKWYIGLSLAYSLRSLR